MKRVVTLVLAAFVALTAALVPAGVASAHAGPHTVRLDLSMTIKDDDWPFGDQYAYPEWKRELKLTVERPSASTRFEGCADEVRVVLEVTVRHDPDVWAGHDVSVTTRTRLYEGENCRTTELEASTSRSFVAREYVGGFDSWSVSSGDDAASIYLTVN